MYLVGVLCVAVEADGKIPADESEDTDKLDGNVRDDLFEETGCSLPSSRRSRQSDWQT
jgi:hypothetical protein